MSGSYDPQHALCVLFLPLFSDGAKRREGRVAEETRLTTSHRDRSVPFFWLWALSLGSLLSFRGMFREVINQAEADHHAIYAHCRTANKRKNKTSRRQTQKKTEHVRTWYHIAHVCIIIEHRTFVRPCEWLYENCAQILRTNRLGIIKLGKILPW